MEYSCKTKWWKKVKNMRNVFGNRRFIRLSSQVEPLLNDYLQSTHDSEFNRDYNDGFEKLCKKNVDLERKIDELALKVNDIKSREIKIERDRIDFEALFKRNSDLERKVDELTRKLNDFQSSHNKNDKEKKDDMEKIERNNSNLKGDIGKLKDKITALDFILADKLHGVTPKANTPPKPAFGIGEIEEVQRAISPNEMTIGIVLLIFLVGFLIGMQIS